MKKISVFLVLGFLTACYHEEGTYGDLSLERDVSAMDVMAEEVYVEPASGYAEASEKSSSLEQDRKIIREGVLILEVENQNAVRDSITAFLKRENGYITEEKETFGLSLGIRIPAEALDRTMHFAASFAREVEFKSTSMEDVTGTFVDVEARLRSKKELEKRYLSLIDKAVKVQELMELERELASVRSEIESMEARFQALKTDISYSKLTITLKQKRDGKEHFGKQLSRAFLESFDVAKHFLLGIVRNWIWLTALVFGGILLKKWFARRR